MLNKVLVANRGEIACRILRTLEKLGIESVAIYSDADRDSPHVGLANEAVHIGPAAVNESYLQAKTIIAAAKERQVDGIHPGYGLLSENADFASACESAGIAFIGPTPQQMIDFGLKHEARRLAEENQVPLLPGTPLLTDRTQAVEAAETIGFPVMLKSTAGGGGIGMQVCHTSDELTEAYASVERLSKSHFGQGGIFLEKFVSHARHLEVQIFGDGQGGAVSLGVRDCSTQRRNQKVIEETPPANVSEVVVQGLQDAALRLAQAVHYRSAGTVEFIYDNDSDDYYFLEVNTRLQVEHGVTELVTGVDLVEWMVRLASGDWQPDLSSPILKQSGHAIQSRLYAENPYKNFQPSSGLLTRVQFPENVRCDHWVETGTEVSPYYDPLLAKLQVFADNRTDAVSAMGKALDESRLDGIETNLDYLRSVVASEAFKNGEVVTKTLTTHPYEPSSFEVLRGGTMTTVQDFPGRTGYWQVGVPPSGPMDSLSLRLGNRLLGNSEHSAGLEITATGPRIQFHCNTTVVLTGSLMDTTLNDEPVEFFRPFEAGPGDILDIGKVTDSGVRSYLCVAGGLDVPEYLGSKSTFTLGQFGGHGGRALRTGDVLHLGEISDEQTPTPLPSQSYLELTHHWEIAVLYGPHGAPDFFTQEDIETFLTTDWEVHYNSARTGVRLIGPKPEWAHKDGGEAGLHPSNIHDNAYAIGAVDFTGDMPVILGPDGPSLGGFVCPVTLIESELWKMGQLNPGDTIRFYCVTPKEAEQLRADQESFLKSLKELPVAQWVERTPSPGEAILLEEGTDENRFVIRQSGDSNVLAEIGDMKLDFKLRFHIHVLFEALKANSLEGIIDLTPGIRSLQVHFDTRNVSSEKIVQWLRETNAALPPLKDVRVPSRIVHLPLSWDDPSTQEAIQKYMQSVRPDAPWCPDNIEFIRRINGLNTREDVYDVLFNASYVVLGLGDVYLGAPVATPLDPRHRLVTTKYNPARTWTPENAVGIGGAYLCIYGMEGPGGYQFVGRTIQMWNRYKSTGSFEEGKPWLLRFFDQIRYYPVSTEELQELRRDFPQGRFDPKIEDAYFSLKEYETFLEENDESIAAFKAQQQDAFEEERARWEAAGLASYIEEADDAGMEETISIPANAMGIESPVAGSMWKVMANESDPITKGSTLAIVESMKMEIKIEAPSDGRLSGHYCKEGQAVSPGQILFAIEAD